MLHAFHVGSDKAATIECSGPSLSVPGVVMIQIPPDALRSERLTMALEILRLAERVKSLENSETRLVAERWEERCQEALNDLEAAQEQCLIPAVRLISERDKALKLAQDTETARREAVGDAVRQVADLAERLKAAEGCARDNAMFQEEIGRIGRENASLKTQVAALEDENASLRRQTGAMEEQMLADRKFALETEKPVYEDLRWHREENRKLREANAKQAEEILRAIREALQAAELWQPRENGQGGTGESAVAAIARLVSLRESLEPLCVCGHPTGSHSVTFTGCGRCGCEGFQPDAAEEEALAGPARTSTGPDLSGFFGAADLGSDDP